MLQSVDTVMVHQEVVNTNLVDECQSIGAIEMTNSEQRLFDDGITSLYIVDYIFSNPLFYNTK